MYLLLTSLWIMVVIVYFSVTTERQRENHLLVMWILLLAPVVLYPLTRLLFQ